MEIQGRKTTFLITGGAGFIGSHLAERLLAEGHGVTVVDDLSSGRVENLAAVWRHPNFAFLQASVCDEQAVDPLVARAQVVIHLAAAVGVQLAVEEPLRTIETNLAGTQSILRAARRHGRRVLLASTSEVYGKGARVPFAEDDDLLLGPTHKSRWSYAASKILDEFLALAFHQQFGLPVVIFRLFNTIGPRQRGRYGMVVPRFIEQALAGEPLTIFGPGRQSRCFSDVRDVVEAIAGLSRHPNAVGRVFNIGSRDEVTILDLARRVRAITASRSPLQSIPYREAYGPGFEDTPRRVPDTTRIRSLLGWKPRHTLDQSLREIVAQERRPRPRGQAEPSPAPAAG